MSRTVTAFYDNFTDAEAAMTHLVNAGLHADHVRIIGPEEGRQTEEYHGFWAKLSELFLPEDDRQAYFEGVKRGGYMIVADVEENDAERAIRTLDDSNSVDFDARQDEWRNSGWSGIAATPQTGAFGHIGDDWQPSSRSGQRETERGSPRVRSYTRDRSDEPAG